MIPPLLVLWAVEINLHDFIMPFDFAIYVILVTKISICELPFNFTHFCRYLYICCVLTFVFDKFSTMSMAGNPETKDDVVTTGSGDMAVWETVCREFE